LRAPGLQLAAVFQTVVFLLESVVFSLIGLQLPALLRGQAGIDSRWPVQALAIAATLMAVRVAWVFPLRRSGSGARASNGHRGGCRLWCRGRVPAVSCRWPPRCPSH